MEYNDLLDRVGELNDLEIVILLCLVAQEHCIIDTTRDALDDLESELRLIVGTVFGLSHTVLDCSSETSVDEFSNAIVSSSSYDEKLDDYLDPHKIVNVIIAKNFDETADEVQLQALDLLQSKRVYTRTAVHSTPKLFLFIPLLASGFRSLSPRLNRHLNDQIFISHYHDPRDGFMILEEDSGWISDDRDSLSSVVRKPALATSKNMARSSFIHEEDIGALRRLSDNVTLSAEVSGYLHNLVIFLRLNRAVASGISSKATNHFRLLVRCLAPLQRVNYVFPSLVAVAARRIYRHRITVAHPTNDRSLLYGSTLKAVGSVLADSTAESAIEDVLAEVEAPL